MSVTDTDDRFVLECPSCDFDLQTDDVDEAVRTAVGHHEHTGHDMEWVQADWHSEFGTETVWEVDCSTCGTSKEFHEEDDVKRFQSDHYAYTDHELVDADITSHELDGIEDLRTELDNYDIGPLKSLILTLEGRHERGAPYEAVIAAASELDFKTSDIVHDLEKLKQRGEVYEPAQGHLRTT